MKEFCMDRDLDLTGGISYFVSTKGNDLNAGTFEQPFATIEKARDTIREFKKMNGMPKGGITVYIRGGEYPMDHTFLLEELDSGAEEAPVIYRAYACEKVNLTGAVDLCASDFSPVTDEAVKSRLHQEARDKIVQVDLKLKGILDYGEIKPYGIGFSKSMAIPELYLNSQKMTLARWPNEGYVKTGRIIDHGVFDKSDAAAGKGIVFQYTDVPAKCWMNADDIWVYGYWRWDWADAMLKVEAIDTENGFIKTAQASCFGVKEGSRYYFLNILEEIDRPGEWYLDRNSGILYFYPPCDMEDCRIQISLFQETCIFLENASNIMIQGLTVEFTRGNGIQIVGGENNRIAGCTIRNIGQTGVLIGEIQRGAGLDLGEIGEGGNGGKNNGVLSCDVYETGMGGITLAGGERNTLTPGGNFAENNHIYRYACIERTYRPGVSLFGVGNRAAHNKIHNAAHMGIGFEGNDHIIEYNEVFDVCREADDSGAIYSLRDWTFRGNIVRYNFIHDIHRGLSEHNNFAVYFDDCMSGTELTGNIFYRVPVCLFTHGGRDTEVINNVMIDCGSAFLLFKNHPDLIKNNVRLLMKRLNKIPYTNEIWRKKYPKLYNILKEDPEDPLGICLEKNLLVNTPEGKIQDIIKETAVMKDNVQFDQHYGSDENEIITSILSENSEIKKNIPGFIRVPFEKIGLYQDIYRNE